jgi:N-alpha-acetyltransferase 40
MAVKRVEAANKLDISHFCEQYFPKDELDQLQTKIRTVSSPEATVSCADARGLSTAQLNACLDLVEETSADDYRGSEAGWSRTKKRKEMKLPDMRYLLVSDSLDNISSTSVKGFVSFMVTYEDGAEVIYVYEIHLSSALRGKGVGQHLMRAVEAIGARIGLRKAMLTVFRINERAVKWYAALGYAEDEFSPPPRRLRDGVLKEPTYLILSKPLQG